MAILQRWTALDANGDIVNFNKANSTANCLKLR